jgi:DNA damage-binding protein 1
MRIIVLLVLIHIFLETSVASTISYLDDGFVYIGSRYGDSQLIKLCLQPNARGSNVEVLETFVNLSPIVEFCVVDIDKRPGGGKQVATCSGRFKDSSLCIVRNGIGFKEKASENIPSIKGI